MYEPNKKLGQNFLINDFTVYRMVDALNVASGDVVVEIGPGLGALTEILAQRLSNHGSKIYAVEIDPRFVFKLKEMFLEYLNVHVIQADILEWLPGFEHAGDYKLIGSLPFYITSPIIHGIIHMNNRPERCVMLVQKEVAERIAADVPDASYFSTFVQTFYDVEYVGEVSREDFDPAPRVDGGILVFDRKNVDMSYDQVRRYEGFLHKGFSNPRKMLNKVFSKDELVRVNVSGNLRPQNINPEKWVEMFETLAGGN
jgi:16S rRNA (adenine1518-N6/adenine1519-N6)-dimethyltransferase